MAVNYTKKSISMKNKMFHSIIKDNSDNEQRWIEHKKYRNCLNRAIMLAKKLFSTESNGE